MTPAELIALAFKASIFLTVVAVGMSATAADALYLLRRPMLLARALLAMHVITLAFVLLLTALFDLHPALRIALFALALSPVPPFMPSLAHKAGGEDRYTIGLMTALSMLSVVIVPGVLHLLQAVFDVPLGISALMVARVVVETVLLPLIVGMALGASAPYLRERLVKPLAVAGNVLLAAAALPILVLQAPAMIELIGNGTVAALAAFVVFGLAAGHALGGPAADDRVVLALSTASRHPAIAIAIAHRNFPEETRVLAAVLLFLIASAVGGALYVGMSKRRRAQLAEQ